MQVSHPSRTIFELPSDPSLGGALRSSTDMLPTYLSSTEHRNVGRLVLYEETLAIGAVFKRVGYLLKRFAPDERESIQQTTTGGVVEVYLFHQKINQINLATV